MLSRHTLQCLHHKLVMIHRHIRRLVDRSHLVLCGSRLIVLGFGGHAQLPELDIDIMHKAADSLPDNAEIMVIHLLTLRRGSTEQRPPCEDNVLSLERFLCIYQKILLLRPYRGENLLRLSVSEKTHDTDRLTAQRLHGAQQRGLFIQCLACIRTERRGNTEGRARRRLLDKCRGGNVPCGISPCLKGCTQSAGGEGGSIRLTLNQLFSRELHEHFSILVRMGHKGIMLLCGNSGQRLEPVCVMGRSVFNRPVLHRLRHNISGGKGKLPALIHDALYFLENSLG